MGAIHEDVFTFMQYLAEFFVEYEMFLTTSVEKFKTHILRSVTFFFENRAIYGRMSKNMV
jgi:hypothetical protein